MRYLTIILNPLIAGLSTLVFNIFGKSWSLNETAVIIDVALASGTVLVSELLMSYISENLYFQNGDKDTTGEDAVNALSTIGVSSLLFGALRPIFNTPKTIAILPRTVQTAIAGPAFGFQDNFLEQLINSSIAICTTYAIGTVL